MSSLQKLGLPPVKIVDILYKANHNPGWKPLFYKIKDAILKSQPVYKEFKRFGYPKEITLFMQYAEMAKDFWGNIDQMIQFSIKRSEDGNNLIKQTWGSLIMYIGYGTIIYFATAIFMLIFQMQSIATALQS
jgi:type II secretory pathway component PulF